MPLGDDCNPDPSRASYRGARLCPSQNVRVQELAHPTQRGLTAEEIDPKPLSVWWATLNDPKLSSLIDRILAGNLELKKARVRGREARAGVWPGLISPRLLKPRARVAEAGAARRPVPA